MMHVRRSAETFIASGTLALLSSCSSGGTAEPAVEQLKGYGRLELGSSLDAALTAAGTNAFDQGSVAECSDNIATQGCFLTSAAEIKYFDMVDGIPYDLQLRFSKFGKLFRASLVYHREGTVNRTECLDIYERTLDWVGRSYGPFDVEKGAASKGEERVTRGLIKHHLDDSSARSFFSSVERTYPGRRVISPLGTFVPLEDGAVCNVSVSFSDDTLGST